MKMNDSIIWAKTNPKPSSSKSNLCPTYEFIFNLVKSSDYIYNPTLSPIKGSTKPSHSPRHRNLKDSKSQINPYIPREGKNRGDWWSEEIV
jgi:DNA modification methylase